VSILKDQAKAILALEESQRQAVLASVLQAREEIKQKMLDLPKDSSLITHYSNLQVQIDEILQNVNPSLTTVPFVAGQAFGTDLVEQSSGGIFAMPAINLQAISQINLAAVDKITEVNTLLKSTIAQQLRTSIALGESIAEATDRLATTGFRRSLWRYELIARTVTNEMANAGANATYSSLAESHSNLRLKKQWSSTLDKRTSPPCQALDGEIQPPNVPFSLGYMHPPALPNCRSRIVAVTAKYDPTPDITKVAHHKTGNKLTDRALAKGKARVDKIPDLQQRYTDYKRLAKLNRHFYTDYAPKLATLEAKYLPKINSAKTDEAKEKLQLEFAKAKTRLKYDWRAKTAAGKSYTELVNRLQSVTTYILNNGILTEEKQSKYAGITNYLRTGIEKTQDGAKPFSPGQQRVISNTAKSVLPILPDSAVRVIPNRVVAGERDAYFTEYELMFGSNKNKNNLRSVVFHELSHSIEKGDPTAIRDAVNLRNSLGTGIQTYLSPDGSTYDVVQGKGIGWQAYAGRVYKDKFGRDEATEMYSVAAETLSDGWLFLRAIDTAPNSIYLLFSRLSLGF
jgi:hypothetical protein